MDTDLQLIGQLNQLRDSSTVIIGIGNALKGDDGAGPLICRQLQEMNLGTEIINAETVPENYVQVIVKKAPDNLLVIDAIDFSAPPGSVKVFKPDQIDSFAFSTHTLSPRLFTEMIGRYIEVNVLFLGIQPAQISLGQAFSPQVEQAVNQLLHILADIFNTTH
ncbi:MAG: hydrogenase 3 maturation endopeptidase HyCI [Planctomycetota bacterium]|jgi:hydrogenase 3 maturation protease